MWTSDRGGVSIRVSIRVHPPPPSFRLIASSHQKTPKSISILLKSGTIKKCTFSPVCGFRRIITLRNQQVILDCDVAELYGVETKRINEAVNNNPEKFPEGYIFVLENKEVISLNVIRYGEKTMRKSSIWSKK